MMHKPMMHLAVICIDQARKYDYCISADNCRKCDQPLRHREEGQGTNKRNRMNKIREKTKRAPEVRLFFFETAKEKGKNTGTR